jgi:hypothetical protein
VDTFPLLVNHNLKTSGRVEVYLHALAEETAQEYFRIMIRLTNKSGVQEISVPIISYVAN